jgi:hypothetical protein
MSLEAVTGIVASGAGSQGASRAGAEAHGAAGGRVSRGISQGPAQNGQIAELDAESLAAHDRDADGRLPWQVGLTKSQAECRAAPPPPTGASDTRGNSLDVTG